MKHNPWLPQDAEIVARVQELRDVFTLWLRLTDAAARQRYRFEPGQFNMLYLHGAGEVPISIVSDPADRQSLGHTIRAVGRVTDAMANLQVGDHIGLRGPFGRGWPLTQAEDRDVLVITGGLGCAPAVSVIHYILKRREKYGHLTVIQGVKHSADLLWREQYDAWRAMPAVTVRLAADQAGARWPWHVGLVTELLDQTDIDPQRTICLMCGPERMMLNAVQRLQARGVPETAIHFSMERNMQCGTGLCGHCQIGSKFTCRDGPVFAYPDLKPVFGLAGF